jgi:hypothetical protein
MAKYIKFAELKNWNSLTVTEVKLSTPLPELNFANIEVNSDSVPDWIVKNLSSGRKNRYKAKRQSEFIGLYRNSAKIDEL